MKRLTYYWMRGSENDGYYLKPGTSVEEARQRMGEIEDILGDVYNLDELRRLVKAYRARECLLKPVNTGDTVWVVTNKRGFRGMGKEVIECRVRGIRLKPDGVTLLFTCEGRYEGGKVDWYVGNFTPNSIGRTVFMAREDAEAKLKGGK